MANSRLLTPRDESLLQLLSRTPATTSLILKASISFAEGAFRDERRVRERLQTLMASGYCKAYSLAATGGGLMNYYKLTPAALKAIAPHAPLPHKSWFAPIAPSRLQHTLELADVIVHTTNAAFQAGITVSRFHREGALTLQTGKYSQQPDCAWQLMSGGKVFNLLFEIDRSTESVDSHYSQSIRNKIEGYQAYQAMVLQTAKQQNSNIRPNFRVLFLTRSTERAYHILSLAQSLVSNRDRKLIYAATRESYLATSDALHTPLCLDHTGHWQTLVNEHPTSQSLRTPVRLPYLVESQLTLC